MLLPTACMGNGVTIQTYRVARVRGMIDIVRFCKQIGTKLIQALLDEADQKDQTVRLFVFKENFGAHKLYQRLGFKDLGIEGGLYIKMEWKSS